MSDKERIALLEKALASWVWWSLLVIDALADPDDKASNDKRRKLDKLVVWAARKGRVQAVDPIDETLAAIKGKVTR